MMQSDQSGQRRRRRALAVGLIAGLLLAACGDDDETSSGEQSTDNGSAGENAGSTSIVIAIADEPSTLDPQSTEDGNERAVTDNIYETLVKRDTANNEIVPVLAEDLPTQVDDTTWEFKLREGITFTNGEPFDAEAAAYSINRVMDPEYSSAQVDFYGGITGAEAVDATTLRVTTSELDPVFPARMVRLKMMPPEATEDPSITENPVGTGPYKFVKWDRGQQVVLEANEDYWGEAPAIESATIRFIGQAGTRLAGLQSNEIHLATLLPPEQAEDAPQVLTRDGLEFPVYRLKNYDGTLVDPKIRQALNYAVDKEAIADELFSGYASVAQCQTLTEAHFGYNPDLEAYPYDPERAEELLDEAGYNGEPLKLLGATGRWLKDAEMHEVVIGYLNAVGVNVEADIRPFSSYIDEFTKTVGDPAQPDIGFVSASNDLFDASKIESYYMSEGGLSSYVNEDVDAELQAARAASDQDEREEHFHEATRIGCEDDPVFIFTVNLQDIYGATADLAWEPRVDGSLYIPEMSFES
jgi:peptide/nickel transport system substrate-binding protein